MSTGPRVEVRLPTACRRVIQVRAHEARPCHDAASDPDAVAVEHLVARVAALPVEDGEEGDKSCQGAHLTPFRNFQLHVRKLLDPPDEEDEELYDPEDGLLEDHGDQGAPPAEEGDEVALSCIV